MTSGVADSVEHAAAAVAAAAAEIRVIEDAHRRYSLLGRLAAFAWRLPWPRLVSLFATTLALVLAALWLNIDGDRSGFLDAQDWGEFMRAGAPEEGPTWRASAKPRGELWRARDCREKRSLSRRLTRRTTSTPRPPFDFDRYRERRARGRVPGAGAGHRQPRDAAPAAGGHGHGRVPPGRAKMLSDERG